MRSLPILKMLMISGLALALGGCLVSEEPILDADNGQASPIKPGDYVVCPVSDEADKTDCDRFSVSHDGDGLYQFDKDGDDPAQMRFRRVGRRGFAVQSLEDDHYVYYYGAGDSQRFRLTMMMCANLPENLRARLLAGGDLESQDDDFETCTVKSLKGLKKAAKAYHRGKASGEDEIALEFTPLLSE